MEARNFADRGSEQRLFNSQQEQNTRLFQAFFLRGGKVGGRNWFLFFALYKNGSDGQLIMPKYARRFGSREVKSGYRDASLSIQEEGEMVW